MLGGPLPLDVGGLRQPDIRRPVDWALGGVQLPRRVRRRRRSGDEPDSSSRTLLPHRHRVDVFESPLRSTPGIGLAPPSSQDSKPVHSPCEDTGLRRRGQAAHSQRDAASRVAATVEGLTVSVSAAGAPAAETRSTSSASDERARSGSAIIGQTISDSPSVAGMFSTAGALLLMSRSGIRLLVST